MQELDRINKLNEKKFRSIPYSERAVFIPHCLRNRDCKARNSEDGWLCIGCGRCKIKEFKNKAEELGYKVFIVPGFSMVKKLIGKHKPKAVVGVSCESEMSIAKEKLGKDVISQGLLLLKDGCVETEADWEKLSRICF